MEMARSERQSKRKHQDQTLSKMLHDLSIQHQNYSTPGAMFSSPTQSIFTKSTKKRKRRTKKKQSSDQMWKTRCQHSFHRLLRHQQQPMSEFTPISKLLQTKIIKINVDPKINTMTYEDVQALFWQIGERCQQVIQFDMSRLKNCTFEAIRALLITPSFGNRLIILRARNQDAINDQSLKLMASRLTTLKVIDFSKCQNVTDTGLRCLINATNIEAISLSECTQITGTTLRALVGELSPDRRQDTACTNLELLDISSCPKVHDLGWLAFGNGGCTGQYPLLHQLKYLNVSKLGNNDMEDNSKRYRTTEKAMVNTLRHHSNTMVLNISHNSELVTNLSMKIIGNNMPKLISLNIAHNRKITDAGLAYVAKGCVAIQAINLSSLGRLTTPGIYTLLQLRANSLKLINMNGLQGTLPVSLILPLCKHLPYAEPALTFYGFKPINDVVHQKLISQWKFIEHAAAAKLQAGMRGTYDRVKVKLLQKVMSNRIQFAWRIYKARMQHRSRKAEIIQQTAASITLQQWMKVILWRIQQKRNKYKQAALVELLKRLGKSATVISSLYRGHYMRHNRHSPIRDVMIHLNGRSQRIAMERGIHSVVVLQRILRQYRYRELQKMNGIEARQRTEDCYYSVRVLQQSIRMFNAKMKLHYLWDAWNKQNWKIFNAAVTIQCLIRGQQSVKKKLRLRFLRREGIKRKHQAAATIQAALTHGIRGREVAYEMYVKRTNAVVKIQALVRSNFVGHWSTMSPNLLYEKWKEKSTWEVLIALQNSKQGLMKAEMEGNSASESDEEWEPVWDDVNQCEMFFSAKRNATRKDPTTLRTWERSLVGQKIMLFDIWDEDKRWVKAAVKKYNSWKNKWKIIYAGKDGDYKWINMREQHHLIMMKRDGDEKGDWCMLRALFPPRRNEEDL